ncbi:MAG: phospholipase [Acidimicrobiia bacterium]|nr:phospholipase [Acidimicrobiia bacterium]NNF68526.1 phospholipase [Acidimicrobiia bacterium]
MKRWLRTGRSTMLVVAGWNLFDALLHVVVDMVEPPRIGGNLAVPAAAAVAYLVASPLLAAFAATLAGGAVLGLNLAWVVNEGGIAAPAFVFIAVTLVLLGWAVRRFLQEAPDAARDAAQSWHARTWVRATVAVVAMVGMAAVTFGAALGQAFERQVHNDELVAADYWNDELVILSAGMGFDNIIGVPDDDLESVRDAGGTYYAEPACVEPHDPLVSTFSPATIERGYRGFADYDDGLPIVVSWPVLTSTVQPEDFLFTLNTGEQVVPHSAGLVPNWELNERNVIVVFGDFGNRGRADEPDAVFPVKLEIVDDGTPLVFLGPDGEQSGVGLTWETDATPYDSGPRLVGAKLNHVGEEPEGEGGFGLLENTLLPNDEFALYGGGDFRLRVLTSGGFSPDGLTGVTPDQYEDFFRIHAIGTDGSTVLLSEAGVDYEVAGGTLRVIGLSDLGKPAGDGVYYDDCYAEDADNYIDIILEGDEAAARSITHIEIPAEGDYLPFYNPGGPGPTPFPDVRYTAPGPPDLEPVTIALDDPMRVSTE